MELIAKNAIFVVIQRHNKQVGGPQSPCLEFHSTLIFRPPCPTEILKQPLKMAEGGGNVPEGMCRVALKRPVLRKADRSKINFSSKQDDGNIYVKILNMSVHYFDLYYNCDTKQFMAI